MDFFAQIATKIINAQENIIGPIAFEQASKVSGLKLDEQNHEATMTGDKKKILEDLVKQYEKLFGRTSIEVCREAVRGTKLQFPQDQLPDILR